MWHFFSFSYDISTIYAFISCVLSKRNVDSKTQIPSLKHSALMKHVYKDCRL